MGSAEVLSARVTCVQYTVKAPSGPHEICVHGEGSGCVGVLTLPIG